MADTASNTIWKGIGVTESSCFNRFSGGRWISSITRIGGGDAPPTETVLPSETAMPDNPNIEKIANDTQWILNAWTIS
ncbi:MAG: hypothetical protein U5O69_04635 [Candidatus Competibacteraceae bacterium]|nr:hypothetical protein [Candidatus Competibacteraceae bacterium]